MSVLRWTKYLGRLFYLSSGERLSPAFGGCGGASGSIPCWGVPQTGQASALRLISAPQHAQKAAIRSPQHIFDALGSVRIRLERRSILCKSGQSITVYGESHFDGSVFAFDEVLGEGFEGVGGGAEGFEGGEGVGDEFLGVFEGLIDAEDGGPGGFGGCGVLACGLA